MGKVYTDIYVNNGKTRKVLFVEVLKENLLSIIVKLPDGNIIKRKKQRDMLVLK
jgi:hypothetical protein